MEPRRPPADPPFPDHFSERAPGYAAHRPGYPPSLADWLAGASPERGLAWDAGCGSGQLSVLLAERFRRVVATDASAEQLAHARPHPHLEYRCLRSEATDLPDRSIDLAVAAQAAHWFDLETYFHEVRRVARPGALCALVTYALPEIGGEPGSALRRFHDEVLAPWWPYERRHVDGGYRLVPFPFDEVDPPEFEMAVEWTLGRLLGYVETWSAVRAIERAEGREAIDRARGEIAAAWGPGEAVRRIRWPLSLRVGRVG